MVLGSESAEDGTRRLKAVENQRKVLPPARNQRSTFWGNESAEAGTKRRKAALLGWGRRGGKGKEGETGKGRQVTRTGEAVGTASDEVAVDGKGHLSSGRKRSIAVEGAGELKGPGETEARAVIRVKAEETQENVRLESALKQARIDGAACRARLWRGVQGEAQGCHAADSKHAMDGGWSHVRADIKPAQAPRDHDCQRTARDAADSKHAMDGGCTEQDRTRRAGSLVGFHARAHTC